MRETSKIKTQSCAKRIMLEIACCHCNRAALIIKRWLNGTNRGSVVILSNQYMTILCILTFQITCAIK
ncbi:MAG: hypothetical protein KAV87_60535, partial [Desulfobacteraceae bacterium]|nr:hypothetical protein [Desulfobacteraceae bacterium]